VEEAQKSSMRCPSGLHRAFRAITEKPPAFSFFVSGNEPRRCDHSSIVCTKPATTRMCRGPDHPGAEMQMGWRRRRRFGDAMSELRRPARRRSSSRSYDTSVTAGQQRHQHLPAAGRGIEIRASFETMFYKGAMDKVGIKADYIQIGESKGRRAYTRTGPSEELRAN